MNYIDLLLQVSCGTACLVIFMRVEPAINRMDHKTIFPIRFSIWLLLLSSVVNLVEILYGFVPKPETTLLCIAIALLLVCERRIRILTGIPKKQRFE